MIENDEYGLRGLQSKILLIILYIDKICRAHDIEYYLMGGSAIGAVRHSGFIPWDDDLDIFMTHEHYFRFLEVCRNHLDQDRFYLQEEFSDELPQAFSKVRLNGTTYLEDVNQGRDVHQGIFVDVMCLNNAPPEGLERKAQFFAAKVIGAKGLTLVNYSANTMTKKMVLAIAKMLPKPFVFNTLLRFVRRHNSKKTKDVCHIFGKAPLMKSYYPRSVIGKPRYVEFEGHQLPVPEDVDTYLRMRFGDYMKLPTEEERLAWQHADLVDVDNSYEKYVNRGVHHGK